MPRENRKRGRKNKTKNVEPTQEDDVYHAHPGPEYEPQVFSEPNPEDPSEDSPFGGVDPDVKAYFRTVDDQLRDWQEERAHTDIEADFDPNEERRIFFTAALSEMHGKELQLATDPDCSPILERMLYSMDDFVRRVFTDSLAGSWVQLMTNRFASHVCQTLFTVAAETVARETRGTFPSPPASDVRGELLTMTQLVLNACEDIVAELPNLMQSAFASHVLRALLLLLAPLELAPSPNSHRHAPSARSKKSATWKARRGPMKAILADDILPGSRDLTDNYGLLAPNSFAEMARKFIDQIRSGLGGNELRALAVDKVASPSLQMILELEASFGKSDDPQSIMDHVLAGLVTDMNSATNPIASPYVSALILDTTSSHLSESIFSCCPLDIFQRVWDLYVRDDLPKLAVHPVANFVVARGVQRLDKQRLGDALTGLEQTWSKSFKLSRTGVLTAMVDRAGQIGAHEAKVVEAVCSMVEMKTDEERKVLVPCLLRLKTHKEYQDTLVETGEVQHGGDGTSEGVRGRRRNEYHKESYASLEPKVQGSVLLQSLFRLHEPHNHVALESLYSLLPPELLALAQNATSSRVLDAALESPTVPLRSRKRLVNAFVGHFHLLVDDRIGSRVADRCWEAADPYLKEKIARSLIPHEQFLAGSHFGRFFARNLSLPLLQRKPDHWKTLHSKNQKIPTNSNAISTTSSKPSQRSPREPDTAPMLPTPDLKRISKRKRRDAAGGDEIDMLFSGIGPTKRAKGMVEASRAPEASVEKGDATLNAVMGAIKIAPSDSRRNKR